MLLNYLMTHGWVAVAVWAVLYCLDYLFTLKAARMYEADVKKHFSSSGGYELNSYFKEDIAQLRRFSFRFWLTLVFYSGMLLILYGTGIRELFAFAWGALVCVQLAVHFRHVRNLTVFYHMKRSDGVSGKIEYEHWLSLRLAVVEDLSFATLFLFLYLLWGDFIALGGTFGFLSNAITFWRESRKSKRAVRGAKS
jgi:hypothetical protein